MSFPGLLAQASTAEAMAEALMFPKWTVWMTLGCAALGVFALVLLFLVSARYLAANRLILRELRSTTAEMKRWGEIAQRQTELANAPLLKVASVEESTSEEGRGTKIVVKNVGFGSAVNVKCILTDQNDKEYTSPQTEIVGNETASFEPPLLIESVKNARLEYLSQGGSYAHTTQYVFKTGAQSYALHRVR